MLGLKLLKGIDEERMKADIGERVREMESPDYRFPQRFGRRDYIIAALVAAFCLGMLIWGYYL